MIACYAWSNLMVLTAMNIKVNYFPDEDMDLFVRMSPGVSRELLQTIRKREVFKNIFYTNVPVIQLKSRTFFKHRLRTNWIKTRCLYKDQYKRMLHNLIAETQYDLFLTAGFWNDSLFYLDCFAQNNPKIRVNLYDEGGVSYDNAKKNLCCYYVSKKVTPLKSRIKNFFPEKHLERKYRKKVENKIYLYSPKRYEKIDKRMQCIGIPLINQNNFEMLAFFKKDLHKIYELYLPPYEKRNIYFISCGNSMRIQDCEVQSLNIVKCLSSIINGRNLVIKTHPNNSNNMKKFALEYENVCYVDRNNFMLEFIYPNIEIEEKMLITYASSSAMYVKTIFDKEPFIILIFRLFHQYHEHGDKNAERYANDLREIYVNKDRIFVPNTLDEFVDNVNEVKRKITKYA